MMADPARRSAGAGGPGRRLARLRAMVVGGEPSIATAAFPAARTRPVGPELAARALALVDAGTTELAEELLTVPLAYYRDEEQLARELDAVPADPARPRPLRPDAPPATTSWSARSSGPRSS